MLKLVVGKPYMIRANIDVLDGLVNGAIGTLRYVEYNANLNDGIKRLWLSFGDSKVGKLIRARCYAHVSANSNLKHDWVPIDKRLATISLNDKVVSCRRNPFPLVEALSLIHI